MRSVQEKGKKGGKVRSTQDTVRGEEDKKGLEISENEGKKKENKE